MSLYYCLRDRDRPTTGLIFVCNVVSVDVFHRYLVGTEDGHIHKCSCSYNEQYLDTFFGHTVSRREHFVE